MEELLAFSSDQDVSGVMVIQSFNTLTEGPSVLGNAMTWRGIVLRGLTACAKAEWQASCIISKQVKCQEGFSVLLPGQK